MRFGLHLTTAHPPERALALASRAEELGFDDLSYHDALLARPPWPVLADFARATSRVRVGPSVSNPFAQHPAVIAANAAHLDEISQGRAFVGLGQGSHFDVVGLDPKRRLRALEEAVDVVRRLTSGTVGAWSGEIFSLGPSASLGFGARRAVPIHLGVFGPRSTRLAGRVADGIRPAGQWDPSFMIQLRDWVQEGAAAAGRDPEQIELVVQNWSYLDEDEDRAWAGARRVLAQRLPSLQPMIDFYRIPSREVAAARAVAAGDIDRAEEISASTVERFMVVGGPATLRAGLDRIFEAGFTSVSFSGALGPDPSSALEMIGDEIARRRVEETNR